MRRLPLLVPVLLLASQAQAGPLALAYSLAPGGVVAEDFDGMGASGSLAPGEMRNAQKKKPQWDSYWSVMVTGAKPSEQYDALSLPGALDPAGYNAGGAGAADRALGVHGPLASTRTLTARLRNDTGGPLAAFDLRFDAEFWTEGPPDSWATVQASVSADGAVWVSLGEDFGALRTSSGAAAGGSWLDGNADANAARDLGGPVDLDALGLAPVDAGADLYLRFEGGGGSLAPVPPGKAGKAFRDGLTGGFFVDNLRVEALAAPAPPAPPGASDAPAVPSFGAPGLAALALALFALAAPTLRRRQA